MRSDLKFRKLLTSFYFANAKGRPPGGMASPFINCFSLLSQTGALRAGGSDELDGFEVIGEGMDGVLHLPDGFTGRYASAGNIMGQLTLIDARNTRQAG